MTTGVPAVGKAEAASRHSPGTEPAEVSVEKVGTSPPRMFWVVVQNLYVAVSTRLVPAVPVEVSTAWSSARLPACRSAQVTAVEPVSVVLKYWIHTLYWPCP